jgi:hypothetical protein
LIATNGIVGGQKHVEPHSGIKSEVRLVLSGVAIPLQKVGRKVVDLTGIEPVTS